MLAWMRRRWRERILHRRAIPDVLWAQTLADQTQASNATDVDMTQALSSFSNQQTAYQAALKSYSMIQGLSMFNYLSSSSG